MYNPFSLEGKKILVTGASSGIGRGIAIECSKMGASVILCGRNLDRLNETYKLLDEREHKIIQADLSRQEEMAEVVAKIDMVNGIVHSAGVSQICALKYINQEKLSEILQINTIAPILLTSLILKKKKL